jgi:hypothetical protein
MPWPAGVADRYGSYGKVTNPFVAGKSAARTAGLPDTLRQVTNDGVVTVLEGDVDCVMPRVGVAASSLATVLVGQ